MPRLFVALDFPAGIQERLTALCCGLPGARWVAPEHMHLTVRFIGEVDSSVFRTVREELAAVRCSPFSFHLEGVGFFPPRGKPRVVWVGISRCEELFQLRNRVESVLVRSGLEPEGRKYSPHVTLARLNNTPGSRVASFLEHNSYFRTDELAIDSFQLYSSVLNSKGAKHYVEEVYPLT